MTIRFTEADFRSPEDAASGVIPVIVERTTELGTSSTLANPITIRVIPMSYEAVLASNIRLPDDFPPVDPFDPRAPIYAMGEQIFTLLI